MWVRDRLDGLWKDEDFTSWYPQLVAEAVRAALEELARDARSCWMYWPRRTCRGQVRPRTEKDGLPAGALRLSHRQPRIASRPVAPPHLLISRNTATTTTAVGTFWMDRLVKELPVGVDRLRQDRILEEALANGADPLHLAHVFSLSAKASLCYTIAVTESEAERTPNTP